MALGPLKKEPHAPPLYEADFFRWTQEQGRALREKRAADVDWQNVAEEIETLGRSERSEIASRLGLLVMHLLKWRHQPNARSTSWRATIVEQRKRLLRLLRENPSLRAYPAEILAEEHQIARLKAAGETGLPLERFSEACPFTLAEILDEAFYPDEAAG
jgi:hypothetical protein